MKTDLISIAIVDDHTLFREGISTIINSHVNFKVILLAKHGKDLLEKLAQQKTLPDICITDINMPVMNGYDTCRTLKEKYPLIKVIALSMLKDNNAIIKLLNNGVNGYLYKDTSPDELIKALSILNKEGYYYPHSISQFIFKTLQANEKRKFDFTNDELSFLQECCMEKSYKEIAAEMGITIRAIEWLRDRLFKKMKVHTRTGLIVAAVKIGVISID